MMLVFGLGGALNAWCDLYLTQATSDKDSPLNWCDVSASSGNMYRHMVMALLTYHLSSVSHLHLILGNLLLLVRLYVGPWPREPSPWPWVPSPWPWVPSPC